MRDVRASWTSRGVAALGALVLASGLAACGSDPAPDLTNGTAHSSQPPTSAPSVSGFSSPPSSSFPDTPAGHKAAVTAAWRRYWHVYDTLPNRPQSSWKTEVSQVAFDPIRKELLVEMRKNAEDGLGAYGRTVLHVKSVKLKSGGTATIRDCQDDSQGGSVKVKTGRKVTVGKDHNLIRGTLTKGKDGQWRVKQIGYLSGVKCEY
jgi:hypothetical protein